MIGRLTGRVVAQEADGGVVLDVGGVGYELTVPLGTLGADEPRRHRARHAVGAHPRARGRARAVRFRRRCRAMPPSGCCSESPTSARRSPSRCWARCRPPSSRWPSRGATFRRSRRCRASASASPSACSSSSVTSSLRSGPLRRGSRAAPGAPRRQRASSDADEKLRSMLTGMGFKPAEADRAIASLGDRGRREGEPIEAQLREALALLAK